MHGRSNTAISRMLSLPTSTVETVVSKYMRTGQRTCASKGRDRSSILTVEQKAIIKGWVNPSITLSELTSKAGTELNITVSYSTINRCLKGFHYTLKIMVAVPAVRNTETTLNTRFNYTQEFTESSYLLKINVSSFLIYQVKQKEAVQLLEHQLIHTFHVLEAKLFLLLLL